MPGCQPFPDDALPWTHPKPRGTGFHHPRSPVIDNEAWVQCSLFRPADFSVCQFCLVWRSQPMPALPSCRRSFSFLSSDLIGSPRSSKPLFGRARPSCRMDVRSGWWACHFFLMPRNRSISRSAPKAHGGLWQLKTFWRYSLIRPTSSPLKWRLITCFNWQTSSPYRPLDDREGRFTNEF